MAASTDDWSVDANEAVHVSLVQPGNNGLHSVHDFHPKFTYPIFGEAEQIFGYKGLEIGIQFASHNLQPHVNISYNKKFPKIGATEALNLNTTLRDFLPPSAFETKFESTLRDDLSAREWKPPGSLVSKYSRQGKDFEIWAGSLLDPVVRQMLDNIQILILFYIEGGQYINLNDPDWTLDRWRVYFVYEKTEPKVPSASSYSLVGYATTYRFYRFMQIRPTRPTPISVDPFPTPKAINANHLPSRLRISQFLVLPPYQRGGHGSALYQAIYTEVMNDSTVTEMTVEDPSEEFDKLRDRNDWRVLERAFRDAKIHVNDTPFGTEKVRVKRVPTAKILPLDALKEIRTKNKIATRQFARQVEMYLLSLIPFSHRANGGASLTKLMMKKGNASNADDRKYYWWRILLKQRIIKKNKDLLQQLPLEERFPQIEDSARGQEDEYEGLLMSFAMSEEKSRLNNGNGSSIVADLLGETSVPTRKRKVVEDEDEDEDDDVGSEPKRAKA